MKARASLPFAAVVLTACAATQSPPPSGASTFVTHCASCHGPQGEGDGPLASVMRVTIPNLRSLSERNDGTFPAESIAAYIDGRDLPLSHGDRLMPIWGDVFDSAASDGTGANAQLRIDTVIQFLRTLQYTSR